METNKEHICIIGGGITGLMTAYYLSNKYKITLIEKHKYLCSQSSKTNAGTLFFTRIQPLNIYKSNSINKLFSKTYLNNWNNKVMYLEALKIELRLKYLT